MTSEKSGVHEGKGPFRVEGLREDGYYELSNGHPVQLSPSSGRHGNNNVLGALTLATDAAVDEVGIDVGHALSEGTLRAPDLSVGATPADKGFVKGAPKLAVEYADTGTDEGDLQKKIAELLDAGSQWVWVVRLIGPRRVEVYETDKPTRMLSGADVLSAPGALSDSIPAAALYDRTIALDTSLRNLLRRAGYRDIDAVREEGVERGREEGIPLGEQRATVALLCAMFARRLGRSLTDDERATLVARIDALGSDAVSAVVLDRNADDVARWLHEEISRDDHRAKP